MSNGKGTAQLEGAATCSTLWIVDQPGRSRQWDLDKSNGGGGCEAFFWREAGYWYRCKDGGSDGKKCRATSTMGTRTPCDMTKVARRWAGTVHAAKGDENAAKQEAERRGMIGMPPVISRSSRRRRSGRQTIWRIGWRNVRETSSCTSSTSRWPRIRMRGRLVLLHRGRTSAKRTGGSISRKKIQEKRDHVARNKRPDEITPAELSTRRNELKVANGRSARQREDVKVWRGRQQQASAIACAYTKEPIGGSRREDEEAWFVWPGDVGLLRQEQVGRPAPATDTMRFSCGKRRSAGRVLKPRTPAAT